jgi:hypothetical protein
MPHKDVARLVVPTIAAACEDPDVRAQFVHLQT